MAVADVVDNMINNAFPQPTFLVSTLQELIINFRGSFYEGVWKEDCCLSSTMPCWGYIVLGTNYALSKDIL